MSAKADRERAERHEAAHQRRINDGLNDIRNAPDLTAAVAHALALYESTQLAHIPTGGGYALPKWAAKPAAFIVNALTETGWTRPQ